MADYKVARSPMADIESRLGIQPIEELLAEREFLVDKAATLRAKYGAFGTFDHLRKIELARIAALIRAQNLRDKIKMTAAEIDDTAHNHPDYRALITEATVERAEWVRYEAKITGIEMTINRGQAVARYTTAEARL